MYYGIILTAACLLLTARYATERDASVRSKVILIAVAALTFVLPSSPAGWSIASTLVRLGVCLFVLLRAVARRPT